MAYIDDVKYATESLISLLGNEKMQIADLSAQLSSVEAKFEHFHWDFKTSDLNDDFSDAHSHHAFVKMAEAKKDRDAIAAEIGALKSVILNRKMALQSLSGALLQIAKQGISIAHGGLGACPDGRTIGQSKLKEVVWQARNQSLHYEEGRFRQPVLYLFNQLAADFGDLFSLALHPNKNMAEDVIEVLGWIEYSRFERDMLQLAV
ncbi:hypothetical protein [Thalassospira aquimaris]|uniref:HEPN AbiU2-like domain-containing protein n=1 Tax=Thalassospira aquimaris TaxID=3037796 RepID=A0ABT6GFE7_9PROT|nr:hypothetical protein [Thalassospira sp. FZY0004]MDG4720720.1 hypothetical protein [Thalassospira sp. FZY0004]